MWPRTPLNIEYGAPCPPPRHAMGLCKRNSLFPALTTCRSFLHAKSLPSMPPHLLSVFSFETDSLSETRTRRGIGFGLTEPPSFDHQPSLSGLDGLARLYIRNEIHIFLELFIFAANDPRIRILRFFFFPFESRDDFYDSSQTFELKEYHG